MMYDIDYQTTLDGNGLLHSYDDKPAYRKIINGFAVCEMWYFHGKKNRKDKPAEIDFYQNKQYIKFFYNGILFNGIEDSLIIRKDNRLFLTAKTDENGEYHSYNNTPTVVRYFKDGRPKHQWFYEHGKLIRSNINDESIVKRRINDYI